MKSLKSMLKFWEEIVFVVSIGLLLIEIIRSHSMDGSDVFLLSCMLPLFICLIGQFLWKKKPLAVFLSVLLGVSSVIAVCMALYGIINSPSFRAESTVMFIVGVVLVVAAFRMRYKYTSENAEVLNA